MRIWPSMRMLAAVGVALLVGSGGSVFTATVAHAQTTEWRLSDESLVRFECAGAQIVEAAGGRFATITGRLRADPANIRVSRGAVEVVMASITTDDSAWDAMFRRAPFLALDEHPRARFELQRLTGPRALHVGRWTRVRLQGEMTVHGVSREQTIPARVRWLRPDDGPERLEVRADFALSWDRFRVAVPTGWTRRFAGDRAEVHVELAFTRRRR